MTFLVGCIATRFLDWLIDGADGIGQEGVAKRKRWSLPDTPVRGRRTAGLKEWS